MCSNHTPIVWYTDGKFVFDYSILQDMFMYCIIDNQVAQGRGASSSGTVVASNLAHRQSYLPSQIHAIIQVYTCA